MATLSGSANYGANHEALYQSTGDIVKRDAGDQHGRVRVAYDSFTINSTDEVGSGAVINMMKLPGGATVVDAHLVMPASGTTGIVDVGYLANGVDAADPNAFFESADPGAAAVDARMAGTVAGFNKKLGAETTVTITASEATADAGGDTWELFIYYVLD